MNIQLNYGILTYISFFCFPLLAQNHFYVVAFCLLVFLSFVLCLLCNSLASNDASHPSIYTCCYVITSAWVKDMNISRKETGSQHNDSIHHFLLLPMLQHQPTLLSHIQWQFSQFLPSPSDCTCHDLSGGDLSWRYAVYCLELPFF